MLETVNKIYFKQSDYGSLDQMFEALFVQELALARNKYMCLTYQSPNNKDIYVLEFASLDPLFNQERVLPCWITAQEAANVAASRVESYQDNVENIVRDALKIDDDDDDGSGGNNA